MFSRRQRGSAAVFGAIAAVAGLSAVALSLDLGRVYYAQRDLQRLANMAALDSARVAGGCLGRRENPVDAAFNSTLESLNRNGGKASYVGANGVLVGRKTVGASGLRQFEGVDEEKNRAVQVSLSRPMPARLIPLMTGDGGEHLLRATAAAYSSPLATVNVGTALTEVDPDILNRLLSGWLGGPVNFDAVTYRNLFGATVPLHGLLPPLSIGTPNDALDAPVPVPNLLMQIAQALRAQGDMVAAAAAQQLADNANDELVVRLADLVGIDQGFEEPATQALLNVGTLIESAAQTANGTNLIDLLLPTDVGDEGATRLRVIEASRQAVLAPGESPTAYARNAQVILETALPIDIAGVGRANLRLFMQTAEATAQVEEIFCARRGHEADIVEVGARNALVRLGIGEFDDIRSPNPMPQPATLLDLSVHGVPVKITGFAFATVGRTDNERLPPYVGPFDELGVTHRLGTPSSTAIAEGVSDLDRDLELQIVLPDGTPDLTTRQITAQLQPLINARLRPALRAALNATGQDLLQDVAATLGLTAGGADVTVLKVTADEPYLFTR